MGSTPAGIKEVAASAGVSVGTVSNVLNRPGRVSEGTRERVVRAMADLGFVRNSPAGALRLGRANALGLVVLDIGNPFFAEVARGAEHAAEVHGFGVLLCNSDSSATREVTHMRFLEEQRVAGILITPMGQTERIEALQARGTPVVFVDEPSDKDRCSASVDDVAGGRLAGEHLQAIGRKRVTYLTGPDFIRQCKDRGRGLDQSGVKVTRLEIEELTSGAGYSAVNRIGKASAIFCANDLLALGLLRGLLEQGIRVPEDVALIGYDDIEFSAMAAIPLTSIRQPARQLGETAASLLLDEITNPHEHVHRQVTFMPELVVRTSTIQGS